MLDKARHYKKPAKDKQSAGGLQNANHCQSDNSHGWNYNMTLTTDKINKI